MKVCHASCKLCSSAICVGLLACTFCTQIKPILSAPSWHLRSSLVASLRLSFADVVFLFELYDLVAVYAVKMTCRKQSFGFAFCYTFGNLSFIHIYREEGKRKLVLGRRFKRGRNKRRRKISYVCRYGSFDRFCSQSPTKGFVRFTFLKGCFFFGCRACWSRRVLFFFVLLFQLCFEIAGGFTFQFRLVLVLAYGFRQCFLVCFENQIEQSVLPGRGQYQSGKYEGKSQTHDLEFFVSCCSEFYWCTRFLFLHKSLLCAKYQRCYKLKKYNPIRAMGRAGRAKLLIFYYF